MQTNALPHYDDSFNTTGCCPRFNPEGWDGQELLFTDKPFVRALSRSVMHLPVNMGTVFGRVQENIAENGAYSADNYIVLSRDLTPWQAEHLFSINAPVKEEEAVSLTGKYITKVFEGPYRKIEEWHGVMRDLAAKGQGAGEVYFFYTTCPKCAKAYGKNYVVGVARVE